MTDHQDPERTFELSGVDHDVAFAEIREQLADLDSSIAAVRTESDGLLESASRRTAMALLDPPEMADDALTELEHSLAALGRHAADVPEEFDPSPFDPDEDDNGSKDGIGVLDDLAAAPAFGTDDELDGKIPPVDVKVKSRALLDQDLDLPVFGDVVGQDGGVGNDSGLDATVLEFVPRTEPSTGDDSDADEPASDAESAFGAMPVDKVDTQEVEAPTADTDPDDDVADAAVGAAAKPPSPDGLDAIAASESTDVPADWDQQQESEAAFDKFFSADVEPEPAQRWLLNE